MDKNIVVKMQKIGAYSVVFFMAFFIALISASAFTPVDNSGAATTEVDIDAGGYSLEVYSADTAKMELTATTDGAVAIAKDTLTITTNSPGYKVYMSMSGNDTKLYNGDSYIETAATTPAPLSVNRWGWALANPASSTSTAIQAYQFDSVYCVSESDAAVANCSDGNSGNLNANNKFAGMPGVSNPALVAYSATSASGATQDIYYGVKVNTAKTAGTYSGRVIYTAVAEASSNARGEIGLSDEAQEELAGQPLTLTTSLYMSDMIYNNLSTSEISVKIGGKDCTGITKSRSGSVLNVSCTTPTMTRWGDYDVVVEIGGYGVYRLENGYSYYKSWDTISQAAAGTYAIQAFTGKTCAEMPAPAGADVANYTGSIANNNYHAVGSYYAGTSSWYDYRGEETGTNPVAEATLKDTRDNHEYRVRKLADGNCWMVDNLRLTLAKETPLTSDTSDINYDMETGVGLRGDATAVRVISNPLKVNGDVLGTYATDGSTGVISWVPYVDTQAYGARISWGSPYSSCADGDGDGKITADECTLATSGASTVTVKYFEPAGADGETEHAATEIRVLSNTLAEAARSSDNGTRTLNDGDGLGQYYGAYYNWYAATAGSGTWAMSTAGTDAVNSVCPSNWQLPDNSEGDGKSFYNLLITKHGLVAGLGAEQYYSTTIATMAPFSFIRSGLMSFVSGGPTYAGSAGGGYYWSRESNGGDSAYGLQFGSGNNNTTNNFKPSNTDSKLRGYAVRCVAR